MIQHVSINLWISKDTKSVHMQFCPGGMKQKIPEHRAVATFRDRFGSGNRVSFRAFLSFTSILYCISKKSSNSDVKKTGDQIANQRTG